MEDFTCCLLRASLSKEEAEEVRSIEEMTNGGIALSLGGLINTLNKIEGQRNSTKFSFKEIHDKIEIRLEKREFETESWRKMLKMPYKESICRASKAEK